MPEEWVEFAKRGLIASLLLLDVSAIEFWFWMSSCLESKDFMGVEVYLSLEKVLNCPPPKGEDPKGDAPKLLPLFANSFVSGSSLF